MADAYRYPLTRICLRTGSLTLPLNLLGVFPERGDIVAVDLQKDAEYTLHVEGRRVLGLGPYFAVHDLMPNDELTIRPLEDGRFAFTAVARPRRTDFSRPDVVAKLIDALVEGGVPMSEAEIRALHPDLPSSVPLRQALERDLRLTLQEGRWRPRLAARPSTVETPSEARAGHGASREREDRHEPERRSKRQPERQPEREPERQPSPPSATERPAGTPATSSRDRVTDTAARRAAARAKEEDALAQQRAATERSRGARAAAARHETGPVSPDPDRREPAHEPPDAAVETAAQPTARPRAEADPVARERSDRERAERDEAARARAEVEAALEAQAAREAEIMALVEADELARAVDAATPESEEAPVEESPLDETRRRTRERLAAHAEDDALASARRQRDDRAARRRNESGEDAPEVFSWDQPLGRRLRLPWLRRREEPKAPPVAPEPLPPGGDPLKLDRLGDARPVDRSAGPPVRVSPAPRPALFAADVGLNSASMPPGDPAKTKRAREAFATLGYRVEGLAHGQLMLHADFGRRFERILVHVLPDDQRLDWAALLARRREAGATHLAVVGDQRDLHRLVAPADLAKSTLWSWAGLDRVLELASSMPIGPFDLEGHFERDGLYEYGLDRFERSIAKRVQERGAFSAVLERLAILKAPAVFLLEDVAGSADVPREQALRVLERLAEAPWHLVSRIDSGEFCLRFRVHDALDQIGAYAASLRARLPERQRDRVRGLPDDLDPIDAADVPAAAEAPEGAAADADATAEGSQAVGVPVARLRPGPKAPVDAEEKPAPPSRLFAGPGLGAEEEVEADEVDVSLVSNKRNRRRR